MFLSCIGSTFTHGPTPWNQQAEISKSRTAIVLRPVAIEASRSQAVVLQTVYLVFRNLCQGNVSYAQGELAYRQQRIALPGNLQFPC